MITEYITKIIQDPIFLKLKVVVENNGYHNQETVYDHLIKTKNIAVREISGDLITDPKAKNLFLEFINQDYYGMKRIDIMILIALLHDIGKILTVKEGSNAHPILVTNSEGTTFLPGHEYWGSTIVGQILAKLEFSEEVIKYIASIIRLHDSFDESYWESKKDWSMDLILNDIKSKAENYYKEALFNIYCDCFTAPPFEYARRMIVKIFNEPKLYIEREYVIT